jgi:Uma2 family endonuclease
VGARSYNVFVRSFIDAGIEAIAQLPAGAALEFSQVGWEDYEQLVGALPPDVHRRVTFDRGRLAVVTPRPEHELFARTIDLIVRVCAERRGQPVESFGSATWKRPGRGRAVEADACYYVTNAPRIIGKGSIDLEVDPPPDIAVEVDVTGSSLDKLPIYEALGVPEVWRYDGATVTFYRLSGGSFRPADVSGVLTGVTATAVNVVLEQSKTIGQTAALEAFRAAQTGDTRRGL